MHGLRVQVTVCDEFGRELAWANVIGESVLDDYVRQVSGHGRRIFAMHRLLRRVLDEGAGALAREMIKPTPDELMMEALADGERARTRMGESSTDSGGER